MSDFMKSCNWKTIVFILLAFFLIYYITVIHPKNVSGMTVPSPQTVWDGRTPEGIPQPSQTAGKNENPISSQSMPMAVTDPTQLLPKDVNSEWSQVNPRGSGQLQNINLLSAGSLIGINTVGSTLRNPNLQLRSEPANPQNYNGPWMNSTIQPDLMRVPLEIGQGPR
jgi:hypothetical protein